MSEQSEKYILRNPSLKGGRANITDGPDGGAITVHFDAEGVSEPVSKAVHDEACSVPGYTSGGPANFPVSSEVVATQTPAVAPVPAQKEQKPAAPEPQKPAPVAAPPAPQNPAPAGKTTAEKTALEKAEEKAEEKAKKEAAKKEAAEKAAAEEAAAQKAQAEKEAAAAAESAKDDGQRPPAPTGEANLADVLADVVAEANAVTGATG